MLKISRLLLGLFLLRSGLRDIVDGDFDVGPNYLKGYYHKEGLDAFILSIIMAGIGLYLLKLYFKGNYKNLKNMMKVYKSTSIILFSWVITSLLNIFVYYYPLPFIILLISDVIVLTLTIFFHFVFKYIYCE